jgi:hypothetical protein
LLLQVLKCTPPTAGIAAAVGWKLKLPSADDEEDDEKDEEEDDEDEDEDEENACNGKKTEGEEEEESVSGK